MPKPRATACRLAVALAAAGGIVSASADAATIAASWQHALITLPGAGPNGTLIHYVAGCGANAAGEVGNGNTADAGYATYTWVSKASGLALLSQVTQVAAGYGHSLAIEGGSLYAWGANDVGQLGIGTNVDAHYAQRVQLPSWTAHMPKPISIEYQAQAVGAGSAHTLLVTPEGYALAWGNNNACQLGPAAMCLYAGGLQTGIASSVPLFVRNGQGQRLTGVRGVAGGERHSLAALADGSVLAWGGNALHQLGLPAVPVLTSTPTAVPGLSGVVAVAAFEDRSVALKGDGTVWQWGTDHYVLNNWDYTYPIAAAPLQVAGLAGITAIAVGRDMSLALAADGTVWYWGLMYAATPLPGLPPIKEIATGYGRRFLRATNNAIYAWGNNARGALCTGEDPATAHAAPVQIVPY